MKTLIIPDLHGKSIWKNIIETDQSYDEIIWLGDYVDSFNHSDEEIILNLKEIIEFVKNSDKPNHLLLGNHEIPYYMCKHNKKLITRTMCSGFRVSCIDEISNILYKNKKLFKLAFQYKNYLFTHAGITEIFHSNYLKCPIDQIGSELNKMFLNDVDFIFNVSKASGGRDKISGPFWTRPEELIVKGYYDLIPNLHQFIGHTVRRNIEKIESNGGSVTLLDCLEFKELIYIINLENGKTES